MSDKDVKKVRGLKIYKKSYKKFQKLLDDENYPSIHGDKIWFSSYFIMDYLKAHPPAEKSCIAEIGSGWGLLSIYCAKNFAAKVVAIDADKKVFAFLNMLADLNDTRVKTKTSRYEKLKPEFLAKQDIVLGADICFWDELIDPLYSVIKLALKNGVSRIIIADPGRSPFLKLAKKCKKKFNAKLSDVEIRTPYAKEGYLLIIKGKNKK